MAALNEIFGRQDVTLDNKGRAAIPAKVRKALAEQFQGTSELLAIQRDNPPRASIFPASKISEDEREEFAAIIKGVTIDRTGRYQLSPLQKKFLGLENGDMAAIVPAKNHIQIMSVEIADQEERRLLSKPLGAEL